MLANSNDVSMPPQWIHRPADRTEVAGQPVDQTFVEGAVRRFD